MNWTFTPQVQGLTDVRLLYDPIDDRELIKYEGIMATGIVMWFMDQAIREGLNRSLHYLETGEICL